jgi:hypothetical protein
VHFPVDSAAGQMLGLTLGQYFVHRALGTGNYEATHFKGNLWVGTDDFQWRNQYDTTADARVYAAAPAPIEKIGANKSVPKSDLLAEVWRLAALEWL